MATIMWAAGALGGPNGGVRRCDATCHNATKPDCVCICGGLFHGGGDTFDDGPARRFWKKVAVSEETDCWLWTGSTSTAGYGTFWNGEGWSNAHRWLYQRVKGPVPEGLQLDHLCRQRNCVRPDHMEPVTSRENSLRGESLPAQNARKTHCPAGHIYDEENTYVTGRGYRNCRACHREAELTRYWHSQPCRPKQLSLQLAAL